MNLLEMAEDEDRTVAEYGLYPDHQVVHRHRAAVLRAAHGVIRAAELTAYSSEDLDQALAAYDAACRGTEVNQPKEP